MKIKYKKIKHKDKKQLKISFCTTCMGRLYHLKETLPSNLEKSNSYFNLEFIILNYNSFDGLEDWVKKNMMKHIKTGKIVYYKTIEPKYFKMSHSKNIAHRLGTGDLLFNLDADVFINKEICHYINKMFKKDKLLIARNSGRICLFSEFFHKVRGYEEKMIGWGQDDKDFYWRCITFLGMHGEEHLHEMTHKIPHGRKETMSNFDPRFKNLGQTRRYNRKIAKSRTKESWKDINKEGYGCGTVYKNFSHIPIVLT